MDEPGSERTNHGTMHGLIAIVTFIAIAAAAGRLGSIAKQVPGWTTLATVSTVIAWLMVASLIAMMVVGRGARATHSAPNYFGAVERVSIWPSWRSSFWSQSASCSAWLLR